jgi:hypothetical protein
LLELALRRFASSLRRTVIATNEAINCGRRTTARIATALRASQCRKQSIGRRTTACDHRASYGPRQTAPKG